MGTDAKFIIELVKPGSAYKSPLPWANIEVRRDYVLFDLLADARSSDSSNAAVSIQKVEHPTLGETYSATVADLKQVEMAYHTKTGSYHSGLRAITAALQAFEDSGEEVRAVFYFY